MPPRRSAGPSEQRDRAPIPLPRARETPRSPRAAGCRLAADARWQEREREREMRQMTDASSYTPTRAPSHPRHVNPEPTHAKPRLPHEPSRSSPLPNQPCKRLRSTTRNQHDPNQTPMSTGAHGDIDTAAFDATKPLSSCQACVCRATRLLVFCSGHPPQVATHGPCQRPNPATIRSAASGPHVPGV